MAQKSKPVDMGQLQDNLNNARRQKTTTSRALTRAQETDLRATDALNIAQAEFDAAYHGVRNH